LTPTRFRRQKGSITIHHAPWSRHFKTMAYRGAFAYELQVGPLVFQWFHGHHRHPDGKRIAVWKDRFWR
jgi:hypothetical protein